MDMLESEGCSGLLSEGQMQRVAVARALVCRPKVPILDEGTSTLDSATEDRVKRMLECEQRKNGMTVVLIAQRLFTVAKAGKIVVLAAGEIRDEGLFNQLMQERRKDHTFRKMVLAQ